MQWMASEFWSWATVIVFALYLFWLLWRWFGSSGTVLEFILTGVGAFSFSRMFAFSLQQSLFLADVGVWLVLITRKLTSPSEQSRYWIRIKPNWSPLFEDHGLVDADGWENLNARSRALGPGWNVMANGVGFTVLGPDLYYSNDHHKFFPRIELSAEIQELRPAEQPRWPLDNFVPRFYVKENFNRKERRHYWEFGLVTLCSNETKAIVFARLPKEFFGAKYGSELSERKQVALDGRLQEIGWERPKRDSDDYIFKTPFHIEHKYVTLYYGELPEQPTPP